MIQKIQTTKQGFYTVMPNTIYAGSLAYHATVFDRVQIVIKPPVIRKDGKIKSDNCEVCGKELDSNHYRFCSMACVGIERGKPIRRPVKRKSYQPRVLKACGWCGRIFKTTVGDQKRACCSRACGQRLRHAKRA